MADWHLKWGEHEWSSDDATVADLIVVTELLEVDAWRVAEPTASPRACVAWLSAFLARASGASIEECQAAVLAAPLSTLVDALTIG